MPFGKSASVPLLLVEPSLLSPRVRRKGYLKKLSLSFFILWGVGAKQLKIREFTSRVRTYGRIIGLNARKKISLAYTDKVWMKKELRNAYHYEVRSALCY